MVRDYYKYNHRAQKYRTKKKEQRRKIKDQRRKIKDYRQKEVPEGRYVGNPGLRNDHGSAASTTRLKAITHHAA
jgi:hypothetical protein